MQLEGYFDFIADDDIRIRGSRIGIESVLYQYVHRSQSPEAIAEVYPSLGLDQIYATILYYLRNREQIDAYLTAWIEYGRQMRAEQERNPPAVAARLRAHKRERQKAPSPS